MPYCCIGWKIQEERILLDISKCNREYNNKSGKKLIFVRVGFYAMALKKPVLKIWFSYSILFIGIFKGMDFIRLTTLNVHKKGQGANYFK